MEKMTYQVQIPVKYTVDILVAGGGPGGFAAAVAAARQGKKVLLVEAVGCFGGLGTAGMVPCYMSFTDGITFIADGIGHEVYDRLQQERRDKTAPHNAIPPEVLKRIYDEMALEAGFDFLFFTKVIGVEKEGGQIKRVVLSGKSGLFAAEAKVFIDATGDGDLSVLAGASYEKGNENGEMMPGTLCSFWTGVDFSKFQWWEQSEKLEQAFSDGVFTVEDRHLTGLCHQGVGYGGGNIGHAYDVDGTDEASMTAAMVEQRKRLLEFEYYYRNYIKGCENAEIVGTASMLGIRETRRIVCDYQLKVEDFSRRAVFEDEIGRNAYPVDIHPKTADPEEMERFRKEHYAEYHYQPGESYGIPYRSLTVKGFDNLLVVGRSIWTDQKMQSSIRIMPSCYLTGQAAGVAAALAAVPAAESGDIRAVSVKQLQENLLKLGAYLPNYKA